MADPNTPGGSTRPPVVRYTPWVVSEHVPDFSSLPRMLEHPRFKGKQGQDLAIALWDLMVDRDLGLFHYCPPTEPFWKYDLVDPLKAWNVFGWSICHCHAHILGTMGRAAGLKTRIANMKGHEGTEFFTEDAWHYFDGDIQMYYRKHPPHQEKIASLQEIHEDLTLVSAQKNPSNPFHFPDRLPEKFQKMYSVKPKYSQVWEERIHSMDYRLRPGEKIQRYFMNRGRWFVYETFPGFYQRYAVAKGGRGPGETGPEGPTERFWPRRQWGNGFFYYAPNLTSASRDAELGAERIEGLAAGEKGLVCQGEKGSAHFAFESPYLLCGVPDPLKRLPAEMGAIAKALFHLPAGARAWIQIRPHGGEAVEIWKSSAAGEAVEATADYTRHVEGRYGLELTLVLEGKGARVERFENTLWFMVSPHSLPALKNAGPNKMSVHHGDAYGLPTRSFLLECRMKTADKAAMPAFTAENLDWTAEAPGKFKPKDPAKPWRLICPLEAPAGGRMAWAAVYAKLQAFANKNGARSCFELADAPEGPWRTLPGEVESGFAFGEGRFSGEEAKGYLSFTSFASLEAFRIAAHYIPAGAALDSGIPLEVEHVWFEDDPQVGRRRVRHLETVTEARKEYRVNCARTPYNEWIAIQMPSSENGAALSAP